MQRTVALIGSMPATEKTWRDQMGMHVIFGVSSLVMLVATVWMLAKDHLREWRGYELNDRNKQKWTMAAQLAQTTAESQSKRDQLSDELKARATGEGRSSARRAVQAAGRSRRQAAAGRGREAGNDRPQQDRRGGGSACRGAGGKRRSYGGPQEAQG